jgi:hypothetical protein
MMLAEQIEDVIHKSLCRDLDHVAKLLWQAHGSGTVSDEEAARLATLLEARRGVARAQGARHSGFKPISFTPRRPQRSPDRQRSLLRRRQIASAGGMPPFLAAGFTVAEQSVLAIIAGEVRLHGTCDRSIDELVARSGTSRSTVQRAIRAAGFAGLTVKQERPRRGQKSETNVIRIVSKEWLAWIRRGPPRQSAGNRVSILKPHGQQDLESESSNEESRKIWATPRGSRPTATGGA